MALPSEKTILVVDDEPDVRQYLAAILEDAGFNVLTATDGEEALKIIRAERPDLISLDLIMPRKSGHKLLVELRRDRELSRIPVLIVTAHARDDLGKQDLRDILEGSTMSGPGTYLEKPIQPLNYVRSIQRALGIEETEDTSEKLGLKEELQKELQGADLEALRKALEALKASTNE